MSYNDYSNYDSENNNSANFKSSKVQQLLDKTRRMIEFQAMYQSTQLQKKQAMSAAGMKRTAASFAMQQSTIEQAEHDEEEAMRAYQSRKIGPFSFDIDEDIDTEVLTNNEILKDLKELENILDKDTDKIITSKMMGRTKRKTHR